MWDPQLRNQVALSTLQRFQKIGGAMRALFVATMLATILLIPTAWAQGSGETIRDPAANTPEATVLAALRAGLAGDFNAYLAQVHEEHKATPAQRSQRERYEWARFKRQVRWYLASESPITFVVARRQEDGANYYRIFLQDQRNPNRMPTPVKLKRDGESWKIVTNSL